MGKITDDQKAMVDAVIADNSLSRQQQADKLTSVYRSFGAPYDRIVFRANGNRFRVVLAKRATGRGIDHARDIYSDGGEIELVSE